MLDRQIGYAAPRIEAIGRGKGLRRAGVLAGAAAAAAVAPRPARNQPHRRVDRAEKQPTAVIAGHHVSKIGNGSGRARVRTYVETSVCAGTIKQKKPDRIHQESKLDT